MKTIISNGVIIIQIAADVFEMLKKSGGLSEFAKDIEARRMKNLKRRMELLDQHRKDPENNPINFSKDYRPSSIRIQPIGQTGAEEVA